MNWDDIFKLLGAVAFSLGGAGALVMGLSAFLGKVVANRILAKETHELATKLEVTKQELNTKLEATKRDLDVLKEKTLRFQNDKILAYREITEIIAKLLAILDAEGGRIASWDASGPAHEFNEQRLKLYGYLAMLAPQVVMDAHDALIDNLLLIVDGEVAYNWSEVRDKVLHLLNAVRDDIGVTSGPIVYKGKL